MLFTENNDIPIVLGVTGHRDLRANALDQLKTEVRGIFTDLHKRYPHTSFILLSPLAAGADRLVAEVALDLADDASFAAKMSLVVPLPWPREICEEQIHRTGKRAEFDRLLDRAASTIEAPLAERVSADSITSCDEARRLQYQEVARYIARHSQLLIALWDGEESTDGGTAQTIHWQQTGTDAPLAPRLGFLDDLENGPVIHVLTPRECSNVPSEEVCCQTLYPPTYENDVEAQKHFESVWANIEQFNKDTQSNNPKFRQCLARSREWILPADKRNVLTGVEEQLLDHFRRADAGAVWFQARTLRTHKMLFGLVGAAVVVFEVYAHLLTDVWALLACYTFLLVVAAVVSVRARQLQFQKKHLDYRALTEALRVQFFWHLAGLRDSVADHYLRTFRSELDWIRQAARACHLSTGGHAVKPLTRGDVDGIRLEIIGQHWIGNQRQYFAKSSQRDGRCHKKWKLAATVFYSLVVLLAVAALIVHLQEHHLSHELVVAIFVCAAAAALSHEHAEIQAFAAHSRRYEWMYSLFSRASIEYDALLADSDLVRVETLLRELGREALAENSDWVLQHRIRPVKSPIPG